MAACYPRRATGRYLLDEELKGLDLKETDRFLDQHIPVLTVNRIFGFIAVQKDDKGIMTSKTFSWPYLYSILIYGLHIYLFFMTIKERYDVIENDAVKTFDELTFLYSYYVWCLFDILPIFFLLESKKIANYHLSWTEFQARYAYIRGKAIEMKIEFMKCGALTLELIFFMAFSAMYIVLLVKINQKLVSGTGISAVFFRNALSMCIIIFDIVATHGVWFNSIIVLYRASVVITSDIEMIVHNDLDCTIEDYEKLWIDLVYLAESLGSAVGFSVSYYMLTAMTTAVIEIFIAVSEVKLNVLVYGSALLLSIISYPIAADILKYQLVDYFTSKLLDFKYQTTNEVRPSINRLLKTVCCVRRSITLFGFVTMNNSMVTSILNTFTTYMIILVQFQQDSKSNSAQAASFNNQNLTKNSN